MTWRTDKPTADVIVAKLTKDFCHSVCYYSVLYRCDKPYVHYIEDFEEIPYSAIEKWADLEEDETVTDCHEFSALAVEQELNAFIASGKAIKEDDCGTYKITYIDPLKVARHFAKWGAEHLKEIDYE